MGYAGYAPAKLPPPKPTEVQAALWKVASPEALELITKLLRNIAVNPKEAKFRQIRLSNPKIASVLSQANGSIEALKALGWELAEDEGEERAVVPEGRNFTMAEVRMVQEAEMRLKKDLQLRKRSNSALNKPSSSDQSRIREQMEADRLERLSKRAK